MQRSTTAFRVLFLVALVQSGCGPSCLQVEQDLKAFRTRSVVEISSPQAVLALPYPVLETLVQPALQKVKPVSLPVPLARDLGLGKLSLRAAVEAVHFADRGPGRLGTTVRIGISGGKQRLFSVTLESAVRIRYRAARRELTVAVRGADLERAVPRLDPKARDSLADWVRQGLPAPLRKSFPHKQLSRLAEDALAALFDREFPEPGRALLDRLGEVAVVTVTLPEFPLRKVGIESAHGHLLAALHLALPESAPLASPLPSWPREVGRRAKLRITGEALAELANRELAAGRLPGRYNEAGKPDQEGLYDVAFAWFGGARPAGLHLWRRVAPCARLEVRGKPTVKVSGKHLKLAVREGRVRAPKAAPAVQAALWLRTLWQEGLQCTHSLARTLAFEAPGKPVKVRVDQVLFVEDDVVFGLRLL